MRERLHSYLKSYSGRLLLAALLIHFLLLPILLAVLVRLGFSELPLEERLAGAKSITLVLMGGYLILSLLMIHFYGGLLRQSIRHLRDISQDFGEPATDRDGVTAGGAGALSSLASDLERMRQALSRREEEIARREARQRAFLENAAEAIIGLDAQGRIETFNRAAEELFRCPAAAAIGRHFAQFLAPGEAARFTSAEGEPRPFAHCEFQARRESGERLQIMLSVSEAVAAGSRSFTLLAQDISERRAHEARLAHQATHDPLTGLPNRALFTDRLNQVLAQAARNEYVVALLFLDLDRFKHINDTLGHHIGDKLLQATARRLKDCLRSEDTLARLGGDEFTLILPHLEQPGAAIVVAENIVQTLERPFPIADMELFISCSIGIACYPLDGRDAAELSRNADTAMYAAKKQGGHGFRFYSAPMNTRASDRQEVDSGLRRAMERGELSLYYQPQVDPASLQVLGVEALLRWQHPERGLVLPGEFIPLAQESGAIAALCDWVLSEACRQGRAWQEQGLPVPVSVNLLGCHLRRPGIFRAVSSALADSGLRPGLLDLELTEGMVMERYEDSLAILPQLKELGVVLSLDNYGTGTSSLSYLRRFPIDILKMDQAFVRDIGQGNGTLAAALIAVAHSLHMKIIAEGVETEEQRAHLQANGCDALQGFYFSKPLPADQLTETLRTRLRRNGDGQAAH